jgi:DNA-binding transcriptional MerR regulator
MGCIQHTRLIVCVMIMPNRDAEGWMNEPVGFPIGFVSLRTGLSVHVLRAWERRYRAVTPKRTDGGQRLYTQADIDRLLLLKQVIKNGNSISHIAELGHGELVEMAGASATIPASKNSRSEMTPGIRVEAAARVVDTCLQAVAMLDGRALRRTLQQATVDFSRTAMLDSILKPLGETIGHRWSEGSLRIIHGHLASGIIHAQLLGMLDRPNGDPTGKPCMLIATPAGQYCYLGALAVAVTAQDHGWNPVFLGPSLPVEEIVAAQSILDPQLVALSITCRVNNTFMHDELSRLSDLLDDRCPLVIGGWASHYHRQSIEASGCEVCSSTAELAHFLV